jgi:hypothetical protein
MLDTNERDVEDYLGSAKAVSYSYERVLQENKNEETYFMLGYAGNEHYSTST